MGFVGSGLIQGKAIPRSLSLLTHREQTLQVGSPYAPEVAEPCSGQLALSNVPADRLGRDAEHRSNITDAQELFAFRDPLGSDQPNLRCNVAFVPCLLAAV